MAIVAVVITKIHNVRYIDALYLIAFQESKHLKMFIAETRTFGFQNVFAHAVFVFQNVVSKQKATKGVKQLH